MSEERNQHPDTKPTNVLGVGDDNWRLHKVYWSYDEVLMFCASGLKRGLLTKAAAARLAANYLHRDLRPLGIEPPSPPAICELIVSLLPGKRRAGMIGDMQEKFLCHCEAFGVKRARRLYWYEVFRTTWPILWKYIKKGGVLGLMIAAARKVSGI